MKIHATENLIALYRNVERRTLDLPWLSFMPAVLYFWEVIKLLFFLSRSFSDRSGKPS
jgi:hypothetical protein